MLSVGLVPGSAVGETGQIAVYFDTLRTMRAKDAPGTPGTNDVLYVFGEDVQGFVGAAKYKIEYGPHLMHITDFEQPPASIGQSDDGISVVYGTNPQTGKAFFLHKVLVQWQTTDCADLNSDYPRVVAHPGFPEPTPTAQEFGFPLPGPEFPISGSRSQTCQYVELDIQPRECPNPFEATHWDSTGVGGCKGGLTTVAILGGTSVDVTTIDPVTCRLEGVSALGLGTINDVSTPDSTSDWTCNDLDGDGYDDLVLDFLSHDVAAAIPPGVVGDTLTLTLTGAYDDGMPFSTSDCVIVIGGSPSPTPPPSSSVALGLPSPNPFNPTTRITYSVSQTELVVLRIYDVKGSLVETLVNEVKAAGDYVIDWNARGLSSGVYFYRMTTGAETVVRRATLLK